MLRPKATARKTPTWPTPTPEQVEVVLLGTYHMDDPGLDEVNLSTDDILTETRQQELEQFVSRLETADPDHVAVECPATHSERVDELYDQYRSDTHAYDSAHEFELADDETVLSSQSEVVQVGFRLADRLDHNQVTPVDVPERLGTSDAFAQLEREGIEPTPKVDVASLDKEELESTMAERLADSTVTGYHRFLNEEAALHANDGMFEEFLRYGDGDNYAGPDALGKWYRRNLRMVHNIWQAIGEDTERVLLLVGSGHVHVLRHLLTEFPQFCPCSALRYLPRSE